MTALPAIRLKQRFRRAATNRLGRRASAVFKALGFSLLVATGTAWGQTPTLVQHYYSGTNSPPRGLTAPNYTFRLPNQTLAGNCLVMFLDYPHGSLVSSIEDDRGNTWPTSAAVAADGGVGSPVTAVYVLPNAASGTREITVTFNTAVTGVHPGRHGVLHNAYFDRAAGRQIITNAPQTWHLAREEFSRDVESVFEAVARSGRGFTAAIDEPADRGAGYSTFDFLRRGEVGESQGALPDAASLPGVTKRFVDLKREYAWASSADAMAAVLRRGQAVIGFADPLGAPAAVLEQRNDGVRLAFLAHLRDATEPFPVTTDRDPGARRRATLADPPSICLLDQAPALALGQRDQRRPVRKAEGRADLRLAQRPTVRQQVSLDGGRRRGDAPGRADPAPAGGEVAPDLFRLGTCVVVRHARYWIRHANEYA